MLAGYNIQMINTKLKSTLEKMLASIDDSLVEKNMVLKFNTNIPKKESLPEKIKVMIKEEDKVKKKRVTELIDNIQKISLKKSKAIISAYLNINKENTYMFSVLGVRGQTYHVKIGTKNYIYKGVGYGDVFIPKQQTFYVSDTGEINELTGKPYNNETISFNDLREIQRTSKMNLGGSNNYMDPEIKERFDIWKLFMYNQMMSMLMWDNIGSG